ncbi:MAG TPA: hypothetical protein VK935_09565, partial [Actinomycetospora sp.]|nr:hypothetical protein [Actinomycetospora sp.]
LPAPEGVPVLRDDPDLVALLVRATDPDPARRHRSVEAFAAEAQRVRGRYPARPGDLGVGRGDPVGADPEDDPTRRGGDRASRRAPVARDPRGAPIP